MDKASSAASQACEPKGTASTGQHVSHVQLAPSLCLQLKVTVMLLCFVPFLIHPACSQRSRQHCLDARPGSATPTLASAQGLDPGRL